MPQPCCPAQPRHITTASPPQHPDSCQWHAGLAELAEEYPNDPSAALLHTALWNLQQEAGQVGGEVVVVVVVCGGGGRGGDTLASIV